ncbi:Hpt domain-containing protein [Pseudomonas sp.]|uniref:Hpt domain-containing protein n=1 Tax=Pseudomonas sp. TaxID=306 RepID=UPI00272C96BB|nr:Hpt domain-containing protein [Pseudomonas sp.]
MGYRHDYVALDWVKGEISETLGQARQALEAYVATPEDSTRLRFCLTYIHQVHGTLQMVEFYGAALLAEEMEKLAQALMHGTTAREGEALEVLMQGILQLPAYLDRVQMGRRDLPLVLLPLLNDMRSARGEKLLSENVLFQPDLRSSAEQVPAATVDFASEQVVQQLRKLRQVMQIAQAAIIREQDVPGNSNKLGRVFIRLESLFQGTPSAELWGVFAGLAEGIEGGSIANGSAVRQLLRQADRELRHLLEEGVGAREAAPPADLMRNLLFYIAKSPAESPRLAQLKQRYQLSEVWAPDESVPETGGSRLVGPDRSAISSVVVALGEELLQVKERLDLFVRSGQREASEMAEMVPTLKQIADTLAMLGLGQPRRVLQEQIEQITRLASGESAMTDHALMDVAGGLLYVEASMQGISGQDREESKAPSPDNDMQRLAAAQDMAQVQQQVVREARNTLEQTRDAINAFIAEQWNHAQLHPVDDLLTSVRGGLAMLGLDAAASVVAACRLYLVEQIITPAAIPDWVALDALADVITSIDYYLERLAEDDSDRGDSILSVALERLGTLKYDADSIARRQVEAVQAASDEPVAEPESVTELPAVEVEEDEAEEDELDEELIEIFIEEAGEVLDTLGEFTPLWQANPDDSRSLTEVRRAFHTLKGSGRMVRAGILAELAWSVENMLNRVIDRNIAASPQVFEVVNAVRALMPTLVGDFAARQRPARPEVELLAGQADALSRGEALPAAQAPTTEIDLSTDGEPMAGFDELSSEVDAFGPVLQDAGNDAETFPVSVDMEPQEPTTSPILQVATDESSEDQPEEIDYDGFVAQDVIEDSAEPIEFMLDDLADSAELPEPPQPEEAREEEPAAAADSPSLLDTCVEAESVAEAEPAAPAGMDPVLLDIFRNEAQIHLQHLREYLQLCEEFLPRQVSDGLQRALHTLKGSAHMAGIQPIARLATPLERLVKEYKTHLIAADQPLAELLKDAVALIEAGVEQLWVTPQQVLPGTDEFLARLDALGRELDARKAAQTGSQGSEAAETSLLSIFLTEGIEALLDAGEALAGALEGGAAPDSRELVSSLRELADVANEVDLPAIGQLCEALEGAHARLLDGQLQLDKHVASTLAAGHERLIGLMDQVAAHQQVSDVSTMIADLGALSQLSDELPLQDVPGTEHAEIPQTAGVAGTWSPGEGATDPELVDIFLEEAQEIIESSTESLQLWLSDTGNSIAVESLQRDLHTLKGGARMAEIRPVGDLAHELEYLYEGICDYRYQPSPVLFELLHACHDSLADMVEGVIAGRAISDGSELISAIRGYRANPDQPLQLPGGSSEQTQGDPGCETTAEPTPAISRKPEDGGDSLSQLIRPPLLGMLNMFIEEARELLEPCPALLERREQDPAAERDLLHRIQTFKGSARLASQHALAEQAKRLEAGLQARVEHAELADALNQLRAALESLAGGEQLAPADWTLPALGRPEKASPVQADALVAPAASQTLASVKAILQQAMEAGGASQNGSRNTGQETVKVPAALLEELVNLAGETSIFRGRIEQQVLDVSHTLADVESTIERVRDQLRRLDMETQSQILSRHQDDLEQGYEDFDPLEMDRYSQLAQLSRSLFESASDLLDLKETLAAKSRDAETLLIQQARVNTELQEGLMRTRMVPFDRLLPRLRRVVRQVSGELGKQVELVVGNAEGEMDRSVLERMIGPLEHMLRNAVDHGIEDPTVRAAAGKPEEGRITLDLRREGGQIVLQMADDGAGINLPAVRRKAIDRGLMDADAELTDQEVLQFILEAGFSTAERVTQISGRGVGMDVVNSEVKQLGGSMTLSTEAGQGSAFIIRLPFTVSVNRALMVYSGEDLYAIPLNTIEGIVRVSGYELEAYYAPDAPPFEYAGKRYDLRYLGDLLGTGQQPRLTGHSLPLPVILVRGSEHSVAVQVDALAGSREIVVKSLGKQFAVVPGISGATILGDGRVVVILDLLAVIRAQHALHSQQRMAAERAQSTSANVERPTLVMVVDDSITVRKVTSRLLERHGMEVITAKDGVEAIAKLQDVKPDVMLLDIEMPRMDGFEVAMLIRHDQRLMDLPIIMITSRTGEKHRERARAIGVNEYLGKPYQESQLLEVITRLVTVRE